MEFDKIKSYKTLLEDLKNERFQIDEQIRVVTKALIKLGEKIEVGECNDKPLNGANKNTEAPSPYEINHDSFYGLSVLEAAKKYLEYVGGPAKSTGEIFDGISKGGLKTTDRSLYVTLATAATKGKGIEKVGAGTWGLTEWYKNK